MMTVLDHQIKCIVLRIADDDPVEVEMMEGNSQEAVSQQHQAQPNPLFLPYQYANNTSLLSYSNQWKIHQYQSQHMYHNIFHGGLEGSHTCPTIKKRKVASTAIRDSTTTTTHTLTTTTSTLTPLIVYGLSVYQDHHQHRSYVVACTSLGEILIWDMNPSRHQNEMDDHDTDDGTTTLQQHNHTATATSPLIRRSMTPWSININDDDDDDDDENEQQEDDDTKEDGTNPNQSKTLTTRKESGLSSQMTTANDELKRPILRLQLQYCHNKSKNNSSSNEEMNIHQNDNDDRHGTTMQYGSRNLPIVLYHCETTMLTFVQPNHSYLIVSGEFGVALFDWHQDILPLILTKRDNQICSSVPFRHYRTYPTIPMPSDNTSRWRGNSFLSRASARTTCPPSYAEVNQTVIGTDDKGVHYLYGVANDTFGCYKWNLETCQIITTFTIPPTRNVSHSNNLYTLAFNPKTKELLTGGEDGQLRVWDTETDQYVDSVNANVIVGAPTNGVNSIGNTSSISIVPHQHSVTNRHMNDSTKDSNWGRSSTGHLHNSNSTPSPPQLYVLSCVIYNEHWWIIGGGFHGHNSLSSTTTNHHGYITIIHGVTRSILSCITTTYKVQHLSFVPNCTASNEKNTSDQKRLMVLTNTNYIYSWSDPFAIADTVIKTPQKIWCHTPSAYAMAAMNHQHSNGTGSMVVGGIGTTIDVYKNDSQLCMQLTTDTE